MARFQTTAAFVMNHKSYKAGTIFADTQGNALAGDIVWIGTLNAAAMSPHLQPLDAGATTVKAASRFANSPVPTIDGVNSIG